MNPYLQRLKPYPFERLNALKANLSGPSHLEHIPLSLGEPKHRPPGFVLDGFADTEQLARELATYPSTRGSDELRETISRWIAQRFGTTVDPDTQVLPVAGTREALFSFGQTVLSGPDNYALIPNPFYQIYEGAAHLRGARLFFVGLHADNGYQPDFGAVPEHVWERTDLVYVCSPGNPTGAVVGADVMRDLIRRAHRYDFVIAADECYSEIYPHEDAAPAGLLEISQASGNTGHERCVVFHSLSKRSNLPGLRSGFVAGDADLLDRYFAYRTYEGCAMSPVVQRVSAMAWQDEEHVIANRARYREKFERVRSILAPYADLPQPDGGFYYWLPCPMDDTKFAADLYSDYNITVLPGSYLGRSIDGDNPGARHVRIAWVADLDDCADAARRLRMWYERHTKPNTR